MAKYVPPHLRARQAEEESKVAAGNDGDENRPPQRNVGGGYGGRGGGGGARFGGGDSRFESLKQDSGKRGGSFSERFSSTGESDSDWFNRRDGRRNNGWGEPSERMIFGEQKHSGGINFDEYDKIPVEVTGDGADDHVPMERFREGSLQSSVSRNLERCGYDRPTPVQKHAIPIVLQGRDVMACAQTGSGKTCAFMVPCIESLLRWGPPPMPFDDRPMSSRRAAAPCALVMSPTRELTSQIFEEGRKFAFMTGIRCCVVYGGADMREQRQELNRGCDILVATPGRLTDMFERGMVTLSLIMFLILDEADRMLDMGFEPQVRQIIDKTDMGEKAPRQRQSMMFSATFPREVQMMARDFLYDYMFLTIGRVGSASELVEQVVVRASEREKAGLLEDIIRDEQEYDKRGLILVFVETKRGADGLERDLWNSGLSVTTIHGDRSQHERERALDSFRSGRTPVMIATDVASRGLDIPNVSLVINFDMPKAIDDYVHRIGRTGRAGNKGKAIALINDTCTGPLLRDLRDLMDDAGQEVPEWFEDMCARMRFGRSGGNKKGGGKGKKRFGAHDMRKDNDFGGNWRNGGGGGGKGGGYRGGDRDGGRRRDRSPGAW